MSGGGGGVRMTTYFFLLFILKVHPFTSMPDFTTHIIDQLLQKAVKVLLVRVLSLVVGLLILFP